MNVSRQLIFIATISSLLSSCTVLEFYGVLCRHTKDKTQHIITQKLDTSSQVVVMKPYTYQYGIANEQEALNDFDKNLFEVNHKYIGQGDPDSLWGYRDPSCFKVEETYNKFFSKNKINYVVPDVKFEDYRELKKELHKIELTLKDSLVNSVTISEHFYLLLNKYVGTHYIFTDIIHILRPRPTRVKTQHWIWYKVFIIDKEKRKLMFYVNHLRIRESGHVCSRFPNYLKRQLRQNVRP